MLILGIVKSVHDLKVRVSLPNSHNGVIEANQISELYTALLLEELNGRNEGVCINKLI